jgi:protein TonB
MNFLMKLFRLALIFHSSFLFGQTTQVYTGKYKYGTASYQYYENEKLDRIYNGSFTFNSLNYTYKGNFKNNLRNGIWTILAQEKIVEQIMGHVKLTSTTTGKFILGNLDSVWTMNLSVLTFKENNTRSEDPKIDYKSSATFHNGLFGGSVNYQTTHPENFTLVGKFSKQGFPEGVWAISKDDEKRTIKYDRGIKYFDAHIRISDGHKFVFYDKTEFVKLFWNHYDSITQISIIDFKCYVISANEHKDEATEYWTTEIFKLHQSDIVSSPLYYLDIGINAPKCFEYEITEADCPQAKGNPTLSTEAIEANRKDAFSVSEQMPQFSGGESALNTFIKMNSAFRMDPEFRSLSDYGQVILRFIVETDGSISNITVAKSATRELDEDAVRLASKFPKFIPGRQYGKAVRVYYSLPIHYLMPPERNRSRLPQ